VTLLNIPRACDIWTRTYVKRLSDAKNVALEVRIAHLRDIFRTPPPTHQNVHQQHPSSDVCVGSVSRATKSGRSHHLGATFFLSCCEVDADYSPFPPTPIFVEKNRGAARGPCCRGVRCVGWDGANWRAKCRQQHQVGVALFEGVSPSAQ